MGSEEFSHFFLFFFRFSSLFRFSSFFFVFVRFSSFFFVFFFFPYSPGTRANDCNLLGKWGISLRPRLHRARSELLLAIFTADSDIAGIPAMGISFARFIDGRENIAVR